MAAARWLVVAARAPTPCTNPEGEGNLLRKRRAPGRGRCPGALPGGGAGLRRRGHSDRVRAAPRPLRGQRAEAGLGRRRTIGSPFPSPRPGAHRGPAPGHAPTRPGRASGMRQLPNLAPGEAAGGTPGAPPPPRPWTLTSEPRSGAAGRAAPPSRVGREVALRLRRSSSPASLPSPPRPRGKGGRRAQRSSPGTRPHPRLIGHQDPTVPASSSHVASRCLQPAGRLTEYARAAGAGPERGQAGAEGAWRPPWQPARRPRGL